MYFVSVVICSHRGWTGFVSYTFLPTETQTSALIRHFVASTQISASGRNLCVSNLTVDIDSNLTIDINGESLLLSELYLQV